MRSLEWIIIIFGAWYLYTHRKDVNVNWPEVLAYSVAGLTLAKLVR